MVKIWGNIIINNKIVNNELVSFDEEASLDLYIDAIHTLCEKLDLEVPVILNKHKEDMEYFNLAKFTPADFIEKVDFQRFEIEIFIDKDKEKK